MNQGNVNFEQTDRGIVVSVNAAVAGQGPKFARTAFPVTAREVGTVSTDFYVYSVNAADMPSILRTLFAQPQTVPAPFSPFLTQYDTYLMRFEDIAD
jgi:beta-galactosidase